MARKKSKPRTIVEVYEYTICSNEETTIAIRNLNDDVEFYDTAFEMWHVSVFSGVKKLPEDLFTKIGELK